MILFIDIDREFMKKNIPGASTCFSVKIPTLVPPSSSSSSSLWNEIPQPIMLSNQICHANNERSTIHVVLMSARSVDRYQEAEVHLKSIVFNRSMTPKNKRAPLVIHMIVDNGGQNYFRDIYTNENLSKFDDLHIIFHNFEYVCMSPVEKFLKALDMKGSLYINS